jgi:hypothetical protein
MRRSIAISLVLLFGLMPIAPLLSPEGDAHLPACCRANGKHHCAMRSLARYWADQKGFTSVTEKCPCPPSPAAAVHGPSFELGGATYFFVKAQMPSVPLAQPRSLARTCFLRSHCKRGPPSLLD